MQTVGALSGTTLEWLAANRNLRPATAEIAVRDDLLIGKKAARHQAAGDALSVQDWQQLPEAIENPERILFDIRSGKLLYVAAGQADGQAKLAIEFDYKLKKVKGDINLIVSAYKVRPEDVEGAIRGGLYQVVK